MSEPTDMNALIRRAAGREPPQPEPPVAAERPAERSEKEPTMNERLRGFRRAPADENREEGR